MSTSIRLKFRPSQKTGCEGRLYFQLTHQHTTYQQATAYKIMPSDWDNRKSAVIIPSRDSQRYVQLKTIRGRVRWEQATMSRLAKRLFEDDESTTVGDVLEAWQDIVSHQPFFEYMQSVIDRLKSDGKIGTSERYQSALRSFERFVGSLDLMLYEVTTQLIVDYQSWLTINGISMNTVSFYMRILRAVCNRAIKQNLMEQRILFSDVYTGVGETRKRAIEISCIQRIKDVDLRDNANLELARDLFMFSFYCRGMAFVDMAYLKKTDVSNGYLVYSRRKTKQQLLVKWEPQMQEIVDKYDTGTSFLLPIIVYSNESEYSQYKRMNKNVCRWLKVVGERANVGLDLTMYVARHSWSSIAKQRNHTLSTISKALGHTSEKTTRIYLASFDNSTVDYANNDILSELK